MVKHTHKHELWYEAFPISNQLVTWLVLPFKRQPHKLVNHTQRIRRPLLSVFDHFGGLVLKGLKTEMNKKRKNFQVDRDDR